MSEDQVDDVHGEGQGLDLGIEGITNAAHIGSGGAADVYKAEQPRLGRTVAVKVLRANTSAESRSRFEREAQTLGRLSNHPGIVTLHEAGLTSIGQPFLMMEFCEAGTLADRSAREGQLGWQETCRIVADIAEVVDEAHEAGVLHRDLKPANVLIDNRGKHLVADFGVAALSDTGNFSAAADFTPGYAPPETLRGEPATPAGDVYSLGATAHALITGRVPFEATDAESNNVLAWIRRIETEPPGNLRPLGVPDAVATVIERAMSKDPAGRPSAQEFTEQLSAAAEGRPIPGIAVASAPPMPPGGGDPATTAVSSVLPQKPTTGQPPMPTRQPPMPLGAPTGTQPNTGDTTDVPAVPAVPVPGMPPGGPTTGEHPATGEQPIAGHQPPTGEQPTTGGQPTTGPAADLSGHTTAVPQLLPQKPTSIEVPSRNDSAASPSPSTDQPTTQPPIPPREQSADPTTGPVPPTSPASPPSPAPPSSASAAPSPAAPPTTGPRPAPGPVTGEVPTADTGPVPVPPTAPTTGSLPSPPTAPVGPVTGETPPPTPAAQPVTGSVPITSQPQTESIPPVVPPVAPSHQEHDESDGGQRKGILIAGGVLGLAVLGLGGLLVASLGGDDDTAATTTTTAAVSTTVATTTTTAPTTTTTASTTTTTAAVLETAFVVLEVTDDSALLGGLVPDQATLDGIVEATALLFADDQITNEMVIDDSYGSVELVLTGSLSDPAAQVDLVDALELVDNVEVDDADLTIVTTTTAAPPPATRRTTLPPRPATTAAPTTTAPPIGTQNTNPTIG